MALAVFQPMTSLVEIVSITCALGVALVRALTFVTY